MKRFFARLLVVLLVCGAIAFALRPVVTDQSRAWRQARAVSDYRKTARGLDTLECGTLLAQAHAYNDSLVAISLRDALSLQQRDADACDALDLNRDGVLAVLSIPKLGATLPVYREEAWGAQHAGAGHMAGSDLPVGGAQSQCVLFGDRNGSFAGLDRLISGDCFYIEAIQDTLIYEVEQVRTLEGDALGGQAESGEADVCMLMTDVPGETQQRLMVRARRVNRRQVPLVDDTMPLPDWATRGILAAPVLLAGWAVLALIEALRRSARRRKLKRSRI